MCLIGVYTLAARHWLYSLTLIGTPHGTTLTRVSGSDLSEPPLIVRSDSHLTLSGLVLDNASAAFAMVYLQDKAEATLSDCVLRGFATQVAVTSNDSAALTVSRCDLRQFACGGLAYFGKPSVFNQSDNIFGVRNPAVSNGGVRSQLRSQPVQWSVRNNPSEQSEDLIYALKMLAGDVIVLAAGRYQFGDKQWLSGQNVTIKGSVRPVVIARSQPDDRAFLVSPGASPPSNL